MRSALLLALALLAAPLTGCLSSGDEDTTLPGGDGEPTTTWRTLTQSGTVEGIGTPGPSLAIGENTASWTVPASAFSLELELTAEGTISDDVTLQYGPDCETEPAVECAYTGQTEEGRASITIDDPPAGGWEMYLFLDTNAGEVDWTLKVTIGERT